MSKTDRKLVTSSDIMFHIREQLGTVELQKIFSRGQTQLNRYCMPSHLEDSQRNPLDRINILIKKLEEKGEEELALATANFILEPLSVRAAPVSFPTPDKNTVEEECLDDFPELTQLDALIAMQQHPREVIRQAEKVKEEIDETIVSYLEHWNKHNEGFSYRKKA